MVPQADPNALQPFESSYPEYTNPLQLGLVLDSGDFFINVIRYILCSNYTLAFPLQQLHSSVYFAAITSGIPYIPAGLPAKNFAAETAPFAKILLE